MTLDRSPVWKDPVAFNRVEQLSFIMPCSATVQDWRSQPLVPCSRDEAKSFAVFGIDPKSKAMAMLGIYAKYDDASKRCHKARKGTTLS